MNHFTYSDLSAHGWHHIEFGIYALVLVLLLYAPPKQADRWLDIAREFVEKHFGDAVGLWVLMVAVALTVVSDIWNLPHTAQAASGLLLAAMGVLKLKSPANPAPDNEPPAATSPSPPPNPPGAPASAAPKPSEGGP